MKIGIISDTHNDVMMIGIALKKFRSSGVDIVIHAGDLTSPDIVALFEGFNTKFVVGNCDTDHEGIMTSCRCSGFSPATRFCEFEIAGKKFFVTHGDDTKTYREAIESRKYDFIIVGHTHEFMARHKHNSLVINPGAVTRDEYSDTDETCAILDTETGEVEKVMLSEIG